MRKIKKSIFSFVFAMIFAPFFSYAQSTAVMFSGNVPVGKVYFLGGSGYFLENSEPKSRIFPGAEIRFNQRGRVSFGVGFQKWELERTSSFSENNMSVTFFDNVKGNVVLGTVYVNLIKRKAVQPFVGFGGGMAFLDRTHKAQMSWAPDYISSEKRKSFILKGVAGVNLYPSSHFVLSVSGGHVNGPAAVVGFGFVF